MFKTILRVLIAPTSSKGPAFPPLVRNYLAPQSLPRSTPLSEETQNATPQPEHKPIFTLHYQSKKPATEDNTRVPFDCGKIFSGYRRLNPR